MGQAAGHAARAASGALDWAPNRTLSLERARERSRFLAVFRWVCVAVAAGALSSLLLAGGVHGLGGGFNGQGEIAEREARTIRNPRFTGRDGSGDPFMVTADTAVRRDLASGVIELDKPQYRSEDGRQVVAARGLYDSEARTLELFDDVLFADQQKQVFRTQYAFIDARRDLVRGQSPVAGAGPLGEVRADTYELRGDLGQVRLSGRVKGVITPSAEREGQP